MVDSSANIIIPIALFIVGLLGYLIYERYFKRKKSAEEEEKTEELQEDAGEPLYARIADNITGRIYNDYVPYKEVLKIIEKYHTLGRVWRRDNQNIYGLCKHKDGSYEPIIPTSTITNSPTDLHNDMQQPEIPILFDVQVEKTWAQKYGKILWWVAIMGFLMFMFVQST